jgi:hypothetical protein
MDWTEMVLVLDYRSDSGCCAQGPKVFKPYHCRAASCCRQLFLWVCYSFVMCVDVESSLYIRTKLGADATLIARQQQLTNTIRIESRACYRAA